MPAQQRQTHKRSATLLGWRAQLTAVLGLLCTSSASWALGLGDIEIYSTLYQPLDAEIEILNVKPTDIERMEVTLASDANFLQTGIDRLSLFNNFRFEIINKSGRYFVHLTSGAIVIREPFLHFLVHADWVSGNLIREYTVILDLPLFGEEAQQARQSDLVVPEVDHSLDDQFDVGVPVAVDEIEETEPVDPSDDTHSGMLSQRELELLEEEEEIEEFEPAVAAERPSYEGDQYGPVQSGDNLWTIVADRLPESVTMNQAMLSVLRANANAFIDNNINLLKTGVILRIPGFDEMLELSRTEALEEAQQQNALWEEYRASVTGASNNLLQDTDDFDLSPSASSLFEELKSETDSSASSADQDLTSASSSLPATSDEISEPATSTSQLRIQPGVQDSVPSDAVGTDPVLSDQASPDSPVRSDAIGSELKENLATEQSIGESNLARSDQIIRQSEIGQGLIDIQSEESKRLQDLAATDSQIPPPPVSGDVAVGQSESAAPESQPSADVAQTGQSFFEKQKAIDAARRMEAIEAQKAAQTGAKGLPAVEKMSTPIDFLKVFLPRTMVNQSWQAIETVIDRPMKITNYPIMLGVLAAILAMLGMVVWLVMRARADKQEMGAAVTTDLGDQFDEFGNPIDGDLAEEYESALDVTNVPPSKEVASESFQAGDEVPDSMTPAAAEVSAPPAPKPVVSQVESSAVEKPKAAPKAKAPVAPSTGQDASLGNLEETTVTEAATYISYALYDQADELLRDAMKRNPANNNAYLSTLIDLYYASGNKDELIKLAQTIKDDYGSGDLWEKIVVFGRAIAGDEPIFKDATIQGKYTVQDFNISPPQEADLALDSSEAGQAEADFSFTNDDSGAVDTGVQLSDDDDFLSQFEENFDKTMADLGIGDDATSSEHQAPDSAADKKKIAKSSESASSNKPVRNVVEESMVNVSQEIADIEASQSQLESQKEQSVEASVPEPVDQMPQPDEPEAAVASEQQPAQSDQEDQTSHTEVSLSEAQATTPSGAFAPNALAELSASAETNLEDISGLLDDASELSDEGQAVPENDESSEIKEPAVDVEALSAVSPPSSDNVEAAPEDLSGVLGDDADLLDGLDEPPAAEDQPAEDTALDASSNLSSPDDESRTASNAQSATDGEEQTAGEPSSTDQSSASPQAQAPDLAAQAPPSDEPEMSSSLEEETPVAQGKGLDLDNLSVEEMEDVMSQSDSSRKIGDEALMQRLRREASADSASSPSSKSQSSTDEEMEKTSDIAMDLSDILGDDGSDDGVQKSANADQQQDEPSAPQPPKEAESSDDSQPSPILHEETSSFMKDILDAGMEEKTGNTFSDDPSEDGDDPFTKTITGSELMGDIESSKDHLEDLSLVLTSSENDTMAKGVVADDEPSDSNKGQWQNREGQETSTSTSIINEEDELIDDSSGESGGEDTDLGLAEQYVKLGDYESARSILESIMKNGSLAGRQKAGKILDSFNN